MRPDRGHSRIHALVRAPVQIDMRTFARKRPGNRKSDPCRRSGYQHSFIGELQVH